MFVEASAIAAMLSDATRGRLLAGRLQGATSRLTAPTCLLDATASLADATGLASGRLFPVVERFAQAMGLRAMSLPAALAAPAAEAMDRFGLVPGQALAYAAARYYRVALLFDDPVFAATDVTPG